MAFNLIYTENYVINALFVDSINNGKEATWIAKLAIIPQHTSMFDQAVILDSIEQEVVMAKQGKFKASIVDEISYDTSGKMFVRLTPGVAKQVGSPTVTIEYNKPFAKCDVTFYSNHLDVNWNMKYDRVSKIHGLMGLSMYYVQTNNVPIIYSRYM